MLCRGYRLWDVGRRLGWGEFRTFIRWLPPGPESAYYRSTHPKSWWWTPEINMMSKVVTTLQWANWQRGGGKGDKPKPIEPPKDTGLKGAKTLEELRARKRHQSEHLKRRRAQKAKGG